METLKQISMAYLFLFALYHLVTGIISVFFSRHAFKFYRVLYGFKPKEKKQLVLIFKPWGNFALLTGLIAFLVFLNITAYFLILYTFCVLLMIRIWYRSVFYKELNKEFRVSFWENARSIIIQILGVILFLYLAISPGN